MSISTQDIVRAKRRFFNSPSLDSATYQLSVAFFSWLAQQGGTPDLQVVEFGPLTGSSSVIADAPCSIYAIVLKKTTTTLAAFKGTDHATTGSSTAFAVGLSQNTLKTDVFFAPKKLPMAAGFTVLSNTTMAGNTTTAAGDGASGVVLLGAP